MSKRSRRNVTERLKATMETVESSAIQQRVVIRVTPDDDWWKLTMEPPSYYLCKSRKQRRVVKIGRMICHTLREEGRPSQLVVHEEDGTIGFENTFLADPVRSPG